MKKRALSLVMAAAVAGTMLTGCGSTEGEKTADKKDSITVLVESGSPAEALAKETAADFKEETGCEVIVDAVAYTGMYDKLSTEIKAKQAAHDVACMDVVWLAAFADAIEPLKDADSSDFLPTLEESGTIDGNLLGYPMWVNSKILIYRKDLIPEDKVPKTWEEYQSLAEELKTDEGVPTTLDEAAYMDGANSLQTFWRVILPICKPGLATAFIFTLFLAWNDFLVALLLTSTNAKTFTVGLAGFLSAYNLDLGPMCAGAFLFSFPVMIISLAAQKYIVQGMTAGAVKG